MVLSFKEIRRKSAAADFLLCHKRSLQALLVALDHLLDHLAADGTGLAGGQVAVVALLEVDADLPWCVFTTKTWLILKSIHITVLDVF